MDYSSEMLRFNGVFTLPDTDIDNDTEKICLQPNCICVGVGVCAGQCEHSIKQGESRILPSQRCVCVYGGGVGDVGAGESGAARSWFC